MKLTCQLIIASTLTLGLFYNLWTDAKGRPKREPFGFSGNVASIAVYVLGLLVAYKAGALSLLVGGGE